MPRSYCLSAIMLLSIYFMLTTMNRVHCDIGLNPYLKSGMETFRGQ
jgi:hypothetical protein